MVEKSLGHYEIKEMLGAGGMGEVYRARDTKLDREVALKILPAEMAADPDRLKRFVHEAKIVAALKHPNIVTIHSVEDVEGVHFITMELVAGTTLSDDLSPNGYSLERFLDLAIPLADAVSGAHVKGVTHRDIKPANIMIDEDGRLKILDFGLAKLREADQPSDSGDEAEDPTMKIESRLTAEGDILGTAAYMSPEQAEGKPVDHRSDIFSLGIVLYKMLTGQGPFSGDTNASVICSILRDTPTSVTTLNNRLPRHLGRIVMRCLVKDPSRRFQTALDLRNELEELREEIRSGEFEVGEAIAGDRHWWKRRSAVAGAAVVAVAALIVVALLVMRGMQGPEISPSGPVQVRMTQLTDHPGNERSPSFSPDGRMIAYTGDNEGNLDIFLLRIGGDNPINLTPDSSGDDEMPAFSPDGDLIAFRSDRAGGGLFVMGSTGESPRKLCDFGFHPSWSSDGAELLFCTVWSDDARMSPGKNETWAVNVESGTARLISEDNVACPALSPGGTRIAYWAQRGGQRDVWTMRPDGGDHRMVTDDAATDAYPVWSSDGSYLYFASDRGGADNLWRVGIEEKTGRLLDTPEAITSGTANAVASFCLSQDGKRVAYLVENPTAQLLRADLDSESHSIVGEPVVITRKPIIVPDVSPDGEWITFMTMSPQEDIFVMRSDGTGRRQLTDDVHRDRAPSWSPTDDRIAFFSNRSGSYEIWTIRSDGSELRQLTHTPERTLLGPIWSPDGSRIACFPNTGCQCVIIDAAISETDQPARFEDLEILPPYDVDEYCFAPKAWSPDGITIAGGITDESRNPVAIGLYSFETREYSILFEGEGSIARYFELRWFPDGSRMLLGLEDSIVVLDSKTGELHEIERRPAGTGVFTQYHLSPDGNTLLIERHSSTGDIWMIELES